VDYWAGEWDKEPCLARLTPVYEQKQPRAPERLMANSGCFACAHADTPLFLRIRSARQSAREEFRVPTWRHPHVRRRALHKDHADRDRRADEHESRWRSPLGNSPAAASARSTG